MTIGQSIKGVALPWRSLKVRVAVFTLLIFFVSIWTVIIYASNALRADMQRFLGEQQFSTLSVVAQDINENLIERQQALEAIARLLPPIMARGPAALQADLQQRPLQILFNGGVFITGPDGTAIADIPLSAGRIGTNYLDREFIAKPLADHITVIGQPTLGKKLGAPVFSIATPILDAQGKVAGALVGVVNLGLTSFLDKVTQGKYGKTGDFLLIDRQHKVVVTASVKSLTMKPTLAPGVHVMHDRYMAGFEGFGVAVNSQGVPELTAAKGVPVADWLLVSTLPAKEAFAPIDAMLQRLLFSAALATLLSGALTWWLITRMLRTQFAPMLSASRVIATQVATNHPVSSLPVARQDEIGELIGNFNLLLDTLGKRERALKDSEAFKATILNSLNAEIAVVDRNGIILAVNDRWQRFSFDNSLQVGEPEPGTGVGASYLEVRGLVDPDDNTSTRVGLQAVLAGQLPSFQSDYRCDSPSQVRWFSMLVVPLGQDANRGAVITHTDITKRKEADAKLQLAANVFASAREGITITDSQATIIDVNDAFTAITGYSREEVVGQNPRILQSGRQDKAFYQVMWQSLLERGHWSGEIWNRRKDGGVMAELITISAVRDTQGVTQQYVALFSDITTMKTQQSQLERFAHFDALTQLPNRVLLADRLQQSMSQATRRNQQLAVLFLDLDGFKAINDHHGHQAGDQVLVAVAQRMKQVLREGDTLARIGGDEFVAVLVDLDNVSVSSPLISRVLTAAGQPTMLGEISVQVTASIGVTFYPQLNDMDADQLLRQADQAMYLAKLAGKNRYHLFDADQDTHLRGQHERLQRIDLALRQHEFVLLYQPKVNMRTGKMVGAEALIRWRHPQLGLLEPAEFLPVIEDHPLAISVGEWVIEQALSQMETWHATGLDVPISVNIGARQLQQPDFVYRLRTILAGHPQVPGKCVELEVLETNALKDIDQVSQVIAACGQFGVRFALDDFGTGYSSLTYLKRLRVALLKIDQSFVRDMLVDSDDLAILQGVIGLANAFHLQVIAEGVETEAHGTALLALGCELAQGFGIAKPLPADQLPTWAKSWRPAVAWSQIPACEDAPA
jgi:diguanylate cyclase (GGDEF)-like protein/PAS domain S-box-containing protein